MRKIFVMLAFCLLCANAFGQELNVVKLDSLFKQLDINHKWMGSVAITQNGVVKYAQTIGIAEEGKNASARAKYRIGSISKTFTAALTMIAVEEKKISLEETILNYFPKVKNADKITIGQLLNHHSGIFNFTNVGSYRSWMSQHKTKKELIDSISSHPSDFEPGSKANYSNSNYVLLGFLLEKIYDQPLQKILTEKITRPLGLKDTYIGRDVDLNREEVNSYIYLGHWTKQPETDMSIPGGAGAVVSTPRDMNRFISALFNGELISKSGLSKMTTISNGFGYGLRPFVYDQRKGYGHNGGIDGFSSMLYILPEDKIAVAITSNGDAYGNGKIFNYLLSAIYGKSFNVPTFKVLIPKTEDLDPYLGEYTSANFPLKITISKKNNILFSQASGQREIQMEATAIHRFEYSPAGITLEFTPAEKKMLLTQGQGRYIFTKK